MGGMRKKMLKFVFGDHDDNDDGDDDGDDDDIDENFGLRLLLS